ncbi:DNA-binding response regulator [Acrocarpospora phusangensis]|uniref:DNA-binding response regulator n=1 Tax=Acrocarpospora phusangensis TaxID=1070424 RepID=A0A919QDH7_9ACTN|nr:response regulator transcription factor [Acrocarpospora phusangensis]GIH26861.1 DNA-binding response regulator [Acrocarpospora phusangensis]
MIRLLVVDDHPVVRDGLRALMSTVDGIEVVAVAEDGAQALRAVREHAVDVVLMDIAMPVMDGVEATRRLTGEPSPPTVVMLTMADDDLSLLAAVRAGARGYLLKHSGQEDVIAAVRAAARGQAVFGQGAADALITLLHAPPAAAPPPFPQLTQREREVLDLLAKGLGNQAIARRLHLSPKTVANTVSAILPKLPARDRAEAVERARTAGLGLP